ncbi:chorismate--pyruvate lyase [Chitinivorax tropicus]|uniref:Probable chorismate pyruvate-lyase n=1 Tax=Chitinivorax tropicus TaxID=714531 RepID=A0A840MLS8_9PROT|nr:chorismate lyase [Chitinivorax tropicus]MBB5017857.1 chorismate--pyruvate lyase [Chitinivorax tropicus]
MKTRHLHDPWVSFAPAHPRRLRPWLNERGSLTARLISHSKQFCVEVIEQRLKPVQHDEARLVKLNARRKGLVREVVLRCNGVPAVFGHTVVCPQHLRRTWRFLARLGNRSLGSVLFANPLVVRQPLHFQRIDRRHPLYRRMATLFPDLPPTLWARRSVFLLKHSPMLVTEVFLPAVLDLPRNELDSTQTTPG